MLISGFDPVEKNSTIKKAKKIPATFFLRFSWETVRKYKEYVKMRKMVIFCWVQGATSRIWGRNRKIRSQAFVVPIKTSRFRYLDLWSDYRPFQTMRYATARNHTFWLTFPLKIKVYDFQWFFADFKARYLESEGGIAKSVPKRL